MRWNEIPIHRRHQGEKAATGPGSTELTSVYSERYSAPMTTGVVPAGSRAKRLMRRAVRVFDVAATPYGVDRYVELVRPTWSSTEVRAKVVRVARTTTRSVTLTLRPNGNWRGFRAGQYTQLSIEIDGVRHTRCYSMTNAATARDGRIELCITAQPEGRVSQHLLQHARRGQTVTLTGAQGIFTLPEAEPEHLLMISGGSGITPVMSMLRTRCALGWTNPVTFVHYALSESDMLYRDELDELSHAPNVRLVRVFTDRPGTGDLDGFLNAPQLDGAGIDWRRSEAFVCGPTPLMEAARSLFDRAGRSDHFHTEIFTLAQFTAEAGSVDGAVHFAASEIGRPSDGTPLLLQAEAAGLKPLHGCRMGICHTCTRQMHSGVVRDIVTGELTNGPDVQIRICVNVPVGDVEIDL
jgi:ferredoxin-NADP reductase